MGLSRFAIPVGLFGASTIVAWFAFKKTRVAPPTVAAVSAPPNAHPVAQALIAVANTVAATTATAPALSGQGQTAGLSASQRIDQEIQNALKTAQTLPKDSDARIGIQNAITAALLIQQAPSGYMYEVVQGDNPTAIAARFKVTPTTMWTGQGNTTSPETGQQKGVEWLLARNTKQPIPLRAGLRLYLPQTGVDTGAQSGAQGKIVPQSSDEHHTYTSSIQKLVTSS